jgi:hypothetical protein
MNRGSHPDTGEDFYVVILRVFAEHREVIASIRFIPLVLSGYPDLSKATTAFQVAAFACIIFIKL